MTNLDVLSNEIHETREAKKTERQVPSSTRTSSQRAAARLSLPPKSALRHRRVQCCVVYDCRRGRAPNWKARFVSRRATRPPAHPSAASLARSAHPDSVRGSDSNLWQAGLRRALAGAGPCDPPNPKAGSRPRCRCKVRALSSNFSCGGVPVGVQRLNPPQRAWAPGHPTWSRLWSCRHGAGPGANGARNCRLHAADITWAKLARSRLKVLGP